MRGHYGQGGGWNAEQTLTLALLPRRPQEITPLLLADVGNNSPAPTMASFNRLLRRGAQSRLPVPFFQVNPPITLPVTQNLNSLLGWFAMTAGLATAFFVGRRSGGIRAGLLNASLGGYPVGGMGIPRVWFTAPVFISTPGEDVIAHEMGHSHGLNHAQCRGNEPWPHDSRLPGRARSIGLHVEDLLLRPPGTPELMGYCSPPTWPSKEGYDLVFDNPA
ncbi:hypothetical protein AB0C70_39625 [Streptomyces sp. NPDC048564]|uniref:hypothetical protein n=1 Tax=Streptomyces sp. NPDC048564 TaxID=3155760 RepID=UPI003416E3F7